MRPGRLSQLTQRSPHAEQNQSISRPKLASSKPEPSSSVLHWVQQLRGLTRHMDIQEAEIVRATQAAGLARGRGGLDGMLIRPQGPAHRGIPTDLKSLLPVFSCQEPRWARRG